jgi:beta-lactamase regulating signal transducer with metallopeptidase domain
MPDSTALLWLLVEWVLRGLVLAAAAQLALAVLRVRDVSVRLAVWTLVLVASLIVPAASLVLPALPVPVAAPVVVRVSLAAVEVAPLPTAAARREIPSQVRPADVLLGLWAVVALGFLARVAIGLAGGHRLVAAARRVEMPCPEPVYESPSVLIPVTAGSVRPVIVLPLDWPRWDNRKLRAVLAHEGSHVRRRDPLRQLLSSTYRALLWFHPLAWWLHRHLSELAEAASDDAALAATGDETLYAEVLLGFFAIAPRRIQWNTVAIATQGKATKRMERILDSGRRLSRNLTRRALFVVVLAALPGIYAICCARPVSAVTETRELTALPGAGIINGITGGVVAGVPGGITGGVPGGITGGVVGGVLQGVVEGVPVAESHSSDGWAIVTGGGRRIYGSNLESRHLQKFAPQGDFLWLRRNGKEYVIREQNALAEARRLMADDMGDDDHSPVLDQPLAEVNQLSERVGLAASDEKKLAALNAELNALFEKSKAELLDSHHDEIERARELLGRAAEKQAKELERSLHEFEGKQFQFEHLAKEMEQKSRAIEKHSKEVEQQMKRLIDEALRSGKAEQVK